MEVIGGILAKITEVIASWFLLVRRSPRIHVEFHNREPFCQLTDIPDGKCYWVRLKITNKGIATACNIRAKLVEIRNEKGDLEQLSGPQELMWRENKDVSSLARQEHDFLDVLVSSSREPERFWLRDEKSTPFSVGTYYLKIQVFADQIKPASVYFEVVCSGDNFDDIRLEQIGWLRRRLLSRKFGKFSA